MQDLNDFYYFVQVVDHGGYAAAGRALGMPRSRLSRRILELEERLGVRLLQRSTRKLVVSEIGQEFYRHCVAMLVEANAAREAVERSRAGPQGLIRVSAPPALVCFEVGPMIARYMAAYPRVTVELDSTSRRVDVIGEGVDIALRVRFPPLEQTDLVMRILGDSVQRMVASPGLVSGSNLPRVPADLAAMPSLDLAPSLPRHVWDMNGPEGASVRVIHKPRLVTDDMSQLLYAALDGVGVVKLPSMVADEHIAAGRLVELLPGWRPRSGIVHAIFPSRRGLLPSVREFIDFLGKEYASLKRAGSNGNSGVKQ
ncbi:MAG TPA: LysR family transcriptional regulator [Xanthobacteraceae bacterium]|nr:LysR family transcriptional regulator [Xanthobacteraceae bacterium]